MSSDDGLDDLFGRDLEGMTGFLGEAREGLFVRDRGRGGRWRRGWRAGRRWRR